MGKRAVFIDRDGTLNEEVGYLKSSDDLALISGAVAAVKKFNRAGIEVFIVTNQAGVARNYFGEDDVRTIHRDIVERFSGAGARIRAVYYCPHHPDFPGSNCGRCICRKPLPGMLLLAASDYDIDLSRSFMIGDTGKDMETGRNAGCRSVLVLTGYGKEEREKLEVEPDFIAEDLSGAADWILNRQSGKRRLQKV